MDVYDYLKIVAGLIFFLNGAFMMSSYGEKRTVSGSFSFESLITVKNLFTVAIGWLLALSGIKNAMHPYILAPVTAVAGTAMWLTSKDERNKEAVKNLIGLAVFMCGMIFMMEPLKSITEISWFAGFLKFLSNPFVGLLVAAVLASGFRSTIVVIGLIEALTFSGAITFRIAIPLVLGANIAANMKEFAGKVESDRKTLISDMLIRIIVSALVILLMYVFNINGSLMLKQVNTFTVATINTVLNILLIVGWAVTGKQFLKLSGLLLNKAD